MHITFNIASNEIRNVFPGKWVSEQFMQVEMADRPPLPSHTISSAGPLTAPTPAN